MNKLRLIFLLVSLSSCVGKHSSDAPKAEVREQLISPVRRDGDTLKIDTQRSMIFWKGTKMRGAGMHSGEIDIKKGHFLMENISIVGGEFIIDMNSIRVTDIPPTDPIPIKNLTEHLKSDDFFDVQNFPVSRFEILKMERTTLDSLYLYGNLTIKNTTRLISFPALQKDGAFTTTFLLDRFLWNIVFEGNRADKTLVDKEMELKLEIQWE